MTDAEQLAQAARRSRGGRRRPDPGAGPGTGQPGDVDPSAPPAQRQKWFLVGYRLDGAGPLRHLRRPHRVSPDPSWWPVSATPPPTSFARPQ
ncbi:MAG: hypothetical protein WKG07_45780 [Hymenobacter sp.]